MFKTLLGNTNTNTNMGGAEKDQQVAKGTKINIHGINVIKLTDEKYYLDGSQSDDEIKNILKNLYLTGNTNYTPDFSKEGLYIVEKVLNPEKQELVTLNNTYLLGHKLYCMSVDKTSKEYRCIVPMPSVLGYKIYNNSNKDVCNIKGKSYGFINLADEESMRVLELGCKFNKVNTVNFKFKLRSDRSVIDVQELVKHTVAEQQKNNNNNNNTNDINILFKFKYHDVTVGYLIDIGNLQVVQINSRREYWTKDGKMKSNIKMYLSRISIVTPEEMLDIALKFKDDTNVRLANFDVQNVYGNMTIKADSVPTMSCLDSQDEFIDYCNNIPVNVIEEFKSKYHCDITAIAYGMPGLGSRLPKKYISKQFL